ncbi:uncharacterized protein [Typha angustifolia]|uniref:uncharacterized protein n=1 Tax=Typha angustifolia TaxID=59011 RepID=UPI003C309E2E
MEDETKLTWTDEVEDLVDRGDVDGAISLLESIVAKLETLDCSSPPSSAADDLRLAAALGDLADIYASRGFSLKADEIRSRAIAARSRAALHPPPPILGDPDEPTKEKTPTQEETSASIASNKDVTDDEDDWEAMADRLANDAAVLSLQPEAEVASSSISEEEPAAHVTPKRRGRGSFLYDKSVLYSDQHDSDKALDDLEDRGRWDEDEAFWSGNSRFGTKHVLVLYDFSPSIRTADLEKLFEEFRESGVAIRWVTDTVALAVFGTPSVAHEALKTVPSQYKVRFLDEDDILLADLNRKDLEPPYPRPKTSARTAQRLIAQGMGMRLSTNFGSAELRKQEEERKNRIVARHTMRDDAWGSDKP